VFFDNLTVQHYTGPLVEESSYYAFGLKIAGISSRAFGSLVNKEKTFQNQRFDDELGLNWVQFKWRNHDPQIGSFIEIDPLSEEYVYNSTYAFSENKVVAHVELEGLESFDIRDMSDNDKVMQGQMSLEEKMQRIRQRATAGMVGVAIVTSVLIPGPDEVLLMGVLQRAGAALRSIRAADKAVDAVQHVKKPEKVVDKVVTTEKKIEKVVESEKKVEKSTKVEKIGDKFTKKIEVKPGKGPGQSRAEYVRVKNADNKTIKTYKDSYDRANKFQGRKPLSGGPEGRPQN
jgi:RHS repeat-associated protein